MSKLRLQKFLAQSGVASRRKAEELIKRGKVSVNGNVVTEMGLKVSEEDYVQVEGKRVLLEQEKIYIALYKPAGYVTTVKDQFGRPSVIDLLNGVKQRIYPVGRLDYDTSGLLLLTNDGEFTYRLTHPKHQVSKVYIADVAGVPNDEEMERFRRGLKIEDYVTSPAEMEIIQVKENSSVLEIKIHEGKNRQVRKMCDRIGHPVISLKRVAIGGLNLAGLSEGQWRELTGTEVQQLLQG